jgi:hypothetical protein
MQRGPFPLVVHYLSSDSRENHLPGRILLGGRSYTDTRCPKKSYLRILLRIPPSLGRPYLTMLMTAFT